MSTRTRDRSHRYPAALSNALEVYQADLKAQNDELQAANEALRRTNDTLAFASDRFRALYQHAPTAYVIVDAARKIVDVNRSGEVILAASRDRLLGATIDSFVAELDRVRVRAFVDSVLVGVPARCDDVVLLRADAVPIDTLIDGAILEEIATDPARCMLAIVDITARRLAENTRRLAQNEVLAVVSHDLRGPLNAIDLACDALTGLLAIDAHRAYLGTISRSTARCERLIKDLLRVAHIESGLLTLEVAALDVHELVQQVCSDHELAASTVGSRLSVRADEHPATVIGDRDRLHQVFSNLLGNALVHARGSAVDVSVKVGDREIAVVISDDGPGIPPGELPLVFERYRQGVRHAGGAGLGLAIVKGLVEAHHGTVAVVSHLGHGTRFEVVLPRGAAARDPSASQCG